MSAVSQKLDFTINKALSEWDDKLIVLVNKRVQQWFSKMSQEKNIATRDDLEQIKLLHTSIKDMVAAKVD